MRSFDIGRFQELSGRPSVKGDMRQKSVVGSRWTRVSISIGVGFFIFALGVSAFFVPQLRLLHVFQALIYVAVIVLTRRNSPWGFGIGVIIPTAWNCLNSFVTHLLQKGAVQFWSLVRTGQFWFLLRTGHVSRPETMMVTVGGVAHFLLNRRLRGRVSSAAASREAMGPVLWRRRSGCSLLRSDYRHCSSAVVFIMQGRMRAR